MKSVFFGIGLMVVISAVAWVVADRTRLSSETANTSPNQSVRLDGDTNEENGE